MSENSVPVKGQIYRGKTSGSLIMVHSVNVKRNRVWVIPAFDGIKRCILLDTLHDNWTLEPDAVFTRVIFKMEKTDADYPESDCVAFLLDVDANKYNVVSYAHIGQHSEASLDYVKECKPATKEQYHDLREELESLGYFLYIVHRITRTFVQEQIKKNF